MAGSSKNQKLLPPQTCNVPKPSSAYKALTFLQAFSSLFFIVFVASMVRLSIETAFKGREGFAKGLGGFLKVFAKIMGGICGVVAGPDLTRDRRLIGTEDLEELSKKGIGADTVGSTYEGPSSHIVPTGSSLVGCPTPGQSRA